MAKYDPTARIAPDLDRHLLFPLLEFLQERQLYPDEQILKSKIELLNKTNMVDYAVDIHKSLYRTATSLKATGHSHSSRTNDHKSDSYVAGSTSHRCSGHEMHVHSPRSSSLTNFIWQILLRASSSGYCHCICHCTDEWLIQQRSRIHLYW